MTLVWELLYRFRRKVLTAYFRLRTTYVSPLTSIRYSLRTTLVLTADSVRLTSPLPAQALNYLHVLHTALLPAQGTCYLLARTTHVSLHTAPLAAQGGRRLSAAAPGALPAG
eukprot:scaffold4283_cov61-Phaeocystis_antarctica.AAC.1